MVTSTTSTEAARPPEAVPQKRSAGTQIALARAAVMAVCLGGAILSFGSGADRLASGEARFAGLVPDALASNVLQVRAEDMIRRGQYADAAATARRAIRAAPVDAGTSALLGVARLGVSDAEGAERAFLVSGNLGWRNAPTQLYWLGRALELGDVQVAAMRLDAILRQAPELAGDTRLMESIEQTPAGREALAARMSASTEWLRKYTRDIQGLTAQQLATRADVLDRRKQTLGCAGVGPLTTALVDTAQIERAAGFWARQCGRPRKLLADADFANLQVHQSNSPFDWIVIGQSDVSVSLRQASASAPRQLQFASSAAFPRKVIQQLVLLPVGRYRLSWEAANEAGQPRPGILVSFSCAADGQQWLPSQPVGSRHAVDLTMDRACAGRWLAFAIAPGAEAISLGAVRLDPIS